MAVRVAGRDELVNVTHRALHALAGDLARADMAAPTICGSSSTTTASNSCSTGPPPSLPPGR